MQCANSFFWILKLQAIRAKTAKSWETANVSLRWSTLQLCCIAFICTNRCTQWQIKGTEQMTSYWPTAISTQNTWESIDGQIIIGARPSIYTNRIHNLVLMRIHSHVGKNAWKASITDAWHVFFLISFKPILCDISNVQKWIHRFKVK